MILVVGATGELGRRVTQRLLTRDHQVRTLVRPSSDYRELREQGAELVFGDLKDLASLRKACDGVKQVVTTASASMRGGADTIETVDRLGTRNLIKAAQDARVKQFVYTSAYGFTADSPLPLARAKAENEKALRESGMGYTILKPPLFMESWIAFVLGAQLQREAKVSLVGDGKTKHGFISIENVADLAAAVIGHPAAENAELPLSAESHSYLEIIEMIEATTGQSIQVDHVAPGEPVPGMPLLVTELWSTLAQAPDFELDTSHVAKTFGIQLISVEEFVRRTFGPGV